MNSLQFEEEDDWEDEETEEDDHEEEDEEPTEEDEESTDIDVHIAFGQALDSADDVDAVSTTDSDGASEARECGHASDQMPALASDEEQCSEAESDGTHM